MRRYLTRSFVVGRASFAIAPPAVDAVSVAGTGELTNILVNLFSAFNLPSSTLFSATAVPLAIKLSLYSRILEGVGEATLPLASLVPPKNDFLTQSGQADQADQADQTDQVFVSCFVIFWISRQIFNCLAVTFSFFIGVVSPLILNTNIRRLVIVAGNTVHIITEHSRTDSDSPVTVLCYFKHNLFHDCFS